MTMRKSSLATWMAMPVLTAVALAAGTATGTWTIVGDVQGTPVKMSCRLNEADHTLTGTCSSATDDKPRALTGEVKDKTVTWHFDTEYEGNPITVTLNGTLSDDGEKMNGDIAVVPMDATGTFDATRKAAAANPAPAAPGL